MASWLVVDGSFKGISILDIIRGWKDVGDFSKVKSKSVDMWISFILGQLELNFDGSSDRVKRIVGFGGIIHNAME